MSDDGISHRKPLTLVLGLALLAPMAAAVPETQNADRRDSGETEAIELRRLSVPSGELTDCVTTQFDIPQVVDECGPEQTIHSKLTVNDRLTLGNGLEISSGSLQINDGDLIIGSGNNVLCADCILGRAVKFNFAEASTKGGSALNALNLGGKPL
jgi:hypothetical protein